MTDYQDPVAERRAALAAERRDRRQREQDLADKRASLAATRAQIRAARGHDGTPDEPDYKPRDEWTTSERQAFAARGVKPLRDEVDDWRDG